MNIKSETKWRQNYYRETEKTLRYYEFLNQNAEVKIHKITPEEKEIFETKTSVSPNPFALRPPRKRRKTDGK